MAHLEWINDELTILAEAFGEPLTEQRQEIYCAGLADIERSTLHIAFTRARLELKWFPKLAELRDLAGVLGGGRCDGRPGPEEAWARMPKGDRMEQDSVVWCEEERSAYGACRSLLLDGDLIGARMAFKERYEKEVAEARSLGKPAQWTMSAGYDVEHRLAALANAVQEKHITLDNALEFVPGERQSDFAQMLAHSEVKGLLTGEFKTLPDLRGLAGVLARLRMEDAFPKELDHNGIGTHRVPDSWSPEDWRSRREALAAQMAFLKRSRNGSGNGSKGRR